MKHKVYLISKDAVQKKIEEVIEEEPLDFYVNEKKYRTFFRTPGEDLPLILGFCFTEGIIKDKKEIISFEVKNEEAKVKVKSLAVREKSWNREGKVSLEELISCLKEMEERQKLRKRTRASHAVMLFSYKLEPISFSEDVARHNALDKAIGKALLEDKIDDVFLAVLSSRISFEMVKKISKTGIKIVFAVSRPTSMAILFSEKIRLSLISLAKDGIIVYSGKERIRV